MWIKIKTQDGPNLSFPVPLSLAGSKLLLSLAANVRRNGHFMLVDVERQNGDIVKIKV